MSIKVRPIPLNCYGLSARSWIARSLLTAISFAALSNGCGFAQTAREGVPSRPDASPRSVSSTARLQVKTAKTDNAKADGTDGVGAARAKLLADMHMLLALSRELQVETAKSKPDTLSLSMVKKAEEIQKLANIVKAEMAKVE